MGLEKDKGFWEGAVERAHDMLAEMRAERDELSNRVEDLNAKILQWERILASLKPVASNDPASTQVQVIPNIANVYLSDACLTIINTVNTNLTARAIRDILEASGYKPNAKHNNALASIHGVLKRLAEGGKIESQETEGKTFYRAKPTVAINAAGSGIGSLRRRPTPEESALQAEQRDLDDLAARRRVLPPPKKLQPIDLTDKNGDVKKIIN